MMGHREQLKGGAEYDGLTRAKRFRKWNAGVRKWIKRKFNKRTRKGAVPGPMVMTPAETLEMQAAETRDRIADKNKDIDLLRAENERLRFALEEVLRGDIEQACAQIAKRALGR